MNWNEPNPSVTGTTRVNNGRHSNGALGPRQTLRVCQTAMLELMLMPRRMPTTIPAA